MKTIHILISSIVMAGLLHAEEDRMKFDTLLDYKNVTVTKVEPDGIRIIHESGAAKIPIEKVPEDIKNQLGLNEEAAKAHREEVRANEQMTAEQNRRQQVLARSRLIFHGSVFQVIEGGLLLRNVRYSNGVTRIEKREKKTPYKVKTGGPSLLHPNARTTYETRYKTEIVNVEVQDWNSYGDSIVFVACDNSRYVDGSAFSNTVYPNGTFAYNSLIGARNTIPAFTTNPSNTLRAAGFEP